MLELFLFQFIEQLRSADRPSVIEIIGQLVQGHLKHVHVTQKCIRNNYCKGVTLQWRSVYNQRHIVDHRSRRQPPALPVTNTIYPNSTPWHSTPCHSTPCHSTPWHSTPCHKHDLSKQRWDPYNKEIVTLLTALFIRMQPIRTEKNDEVMLVFNARPHGTAVLVHVYVT